MSEVVICDTLLKQYLAFKSGKEVDIRTVEALLKYFKPYLTNFRQAKAVGLSDTAVMSQLMASGLVDQSLEDLCQRSALKIILSDQKSEYPYVNIFGDILMNRYSATFGKTEDRKKCRAHIKALLQDARTVFIHDRYMVSQWDCCQVFFKDLMPKKPLTIFHTGCLKDKAGELKKICAQWMVKEDKLNKAYRGRHDRYLVIDGKIEVMFSSGFDYITDESKDLTYVVGIVG
jgi:hypothetical protein